MSVREYIEARSMPVPFSGCWLLAMLATLTDERDTALARVAEMEAELAKQAPVIEAAREQAAAARATASGHPDAHDNWGEACDATESAIRTLDKETP